MNQELINQLKDYNREILMSSEGRQMIQESIQKKKEWNDTRGDVTLSTEGVNTTLLNEFIQQRTTIIGIIPIGLNNQCHRNSLKFGKKLRSKPIIGFNITACPCGRKVCFELHSVNEYRGVLYDFTKDFNNETEKYFMRLDTPSNIFQIINCFGKEPKAMDKGCNCPIEWNDSGENELTEEELIHYFSAIERIKIWN
jgi:type 1 glutamine amidotransferase